MQPLVSVCIPAYNNAGYIKETIDSILNQTYSNIELIISDDKSTDNTIEVIESIGDSRIKLYKNEKNLGMSGNWNRCLELCQGEFMKLICADDMLAKDAIEKEVNALLENPEAVMVESDTRLVDLNGKYKGWYKRRGNGLVEGKKIARAGVFSQNYFGAPLANTFRRSAYEKVKGFDTNFVYILDYDFLIRIACLGKIYVIHEPLNFFRVRNDSNTGNVMSAGEKNRIYVAEHRYLIEKHASELHLSKFEIELSVLIRRLRCFAASVYLKLFVHE